ncbi:MAG TPA: 4-alpha-glucanotransferase, partial [Thermoanaerobaculia bacterium]|nr:4-alpha-glucanotransferase [Thermoanaerobaculia bacterium]
MPDRAAGILAHVTSLPGRFGIGDMGPGVDAFLDFLTAAGQKQWHVMPLGPTGYHHSPYAVISAFAGNPLLISPERLVEDGLLPSTALDDAPSFPEDHVDFQSVAAWREKLLRQSWQRFSSGGGAPSEVREAFAAFVDAPEQRIWLDDFALFAALSHRDGTTDYTAWEPSLTRRDAAALSRARAEVEPEIRFHEFVQYLFFSQWKKVREAANARGVLVVGDLPIYVAFGSADVWANPRLFELDENGKRISVAGVPPDYFSATGQLWGNPLYRWNVHEEEGFAWWIERMRREERLCDRIRLDHFRGFAAYYSIPAGDETAARGKWIPGPGEKLFSALEGALGDLPLIAEDLGYITPDVHALRDAVGFPGT